MLVILGSACIAIAGEPGQLDDNRLRAALQPQFAVGLQPHQLLVGAVADAARQLPESIQGSVAISVAAGGYARQVLARYVDALGRTGLESLTRDDATRLEPSLLNEEAGKATGIHGPALTLVGSQDGAVGGLLWAIDAIAGGELPAVLAAELGEIGSPPLPFAICLPLLAAQASAERALDWRPTRAPRPQARQVHSVLCELAVRASGQSGVEPIPASLGDLHLEFVLESRHDG